ncbi:hypothetical protein MalM25_28820 [Planctomycetes bacterium MalM25]|nr:hypothetical protein MalM25_28820 [Planctomycetes bacterium MalM25]
MPTLADQPPLRLVAVAADPDRAAPLARSIAAELGAESPRLVGSIADALTLLRSESFDALIALHDPSDLDALVLSRALRGAGDETPVAVLGTARAIDAESAAWDAGADEYACLSDITAEQLAGRLRRAIDARQRLREARRVLVADQQRLASEHAEAQRLLSEQRRLLTALQETEQPANTASQSIPLTAARPAEVEYIGLLRKGLTESGATTAAVAQVADRLAAEGTTGPRLFELHLSEVSSALEGLGPKAVRVVRANADRLLLEAIVHLAEAYRRQYVEAVPTMADAVADPPPARAA